MRDSRNSDVTNKIFEVLNNTKGFDIAKGNPSTGVMIMRYNGVTFYLIVEPMFDNDKVGNNAEKESFDYIWQTHSAAMH